MARPRKCRRICSIPKADKFLPTNNFHNSITLTLDEYECIRLIDKQGFSQEECAVHMQIARTTAQLIYNSARFKIATALTDGFGICIEGGEYHFDGCNEKHCKCGGYRYEKSNNGTE